MLLAVDPEHVEAHRGVWRILCVDPEWYYPDDDPANQPAYLRAVAHLAEILKIVPDDMEANTAMGVYMGDIGKLEDALHHFAIALSGDEENPCLHYNYGTILWRTGQFGKAIEQYQSTLQLDTLHPRAHYNIGTCFLLMGQTDEAIHHFKADIEVAKELSLLAGEEKDGKEKVADELDGALALAYETRAKTAVAVKANAGSAPKEDPNEGDMGSDDESAVDAVDGETTLEIGSAAGGSMLEGEGGIPSGENGVDGGSVADGRSIKQGGSIVVSEKGSETAGGEEDTTPSMVPSVVDVDENKGASLRAEMKERADGLIQK